MLKLPSWCSYKRVIIGVSKDLPGNTRGKMSEDGFYDITLSLKKVKLNISPEELKKGLDVFLMDKISQELDVISSKRKMIYGEDQESKKSILIKKRFSSISHYMTVPEELLKNNEGIKIDLLINSHMSELKRGALQGDVFLINYAIPSVSGYRMVISVDDDKIRTSPLKWTEFMREIPAHFNVLIDQEPNYFEPVPYKPRTKERVKKELSKYDGSRWKQINNVREKRFIISVKMDYLKITWSEASGIPIGLFMFNKKSRVLVGLSSKPIGRYIVNGDERDIRKIFPKYKEDFLDYLEVSEFYVLYE